MRFFFFRNVMLNPAKDGCIVDAESSSVDLCNLTLNLTPK